jgi:hypothetical protein
MDVTKEIHTQQRKAAKRGREIIKYGYAINETLNQKELCWRGPSLIYPTYELLVHSKLSWLIFKVIAEYLPTTSLLI